MSDTVLALVSDLFFVGKIEETARQLGASLHVVPSAERLFAEIQSAAPRLVLIDLNYDAAESPRTIARLKREDSTQSIRVVAFLSHVQEDLARAAREAGADAVLPRSRFSQTLPDILKDQD